MTASEMTTARAIVYLRVSTQGQADTDFSAEGFSIPAQRDACYRAAERVGATVIDEYLDRGESARSAARPALQQMLARLKEHKDIDYVIVHKVDRLARSREDDVAIALAIKRSGAQLVSATENIDDTPSGKLLHGIMATIAEFYSANLSAEAKKGLQQKAKLGGTVTLAPVGYLNVVERVEGAKEVRTVAIDPERAPHVKWAFETFATGDWTIRQLTEALEARGLRTRATAKQASKPMSLSRVHKMLRHPYYMGVVLYQGAEYPGRHQPIITPELFFEVQQALDAHRLWGERPQRRTHYLKGTLFCGLCKRMMSIGYSRGRGGVYAYFFCLGRHRDKSCTLPYLSIEKVEQMVEDYWQGVVVDPEQLEAIRIDVRRHLKTVTKQNEGERHRQAERLKQLDAESRKLMQALYNDAVPMDLLKEEQARIARDKSAAQIIMDSLVAEYEQVTSALDEALQVIANSHVIYESGSPLVRRDLNHFMFDRLFIVPDGVAGADLASPYVELLTDDLGQRLAQAEAIAVGSTELGRVPSVACVVTPSTPALATWLERPRGLLPAETENPANFRQPGSNLSVLVGLRGFEPPTS